MSAKHTPGPWFCHLGRPDSEIDGCRCRSVLAEPYMGCIAQVSVDNGKDISDGGNDSPPETEARANARLISAAPDLLEILVAIIGHGIDYPDLEAKARAAISKATGAH